MQRSSRQLDRSVKQLQGSWDIGGSIVSVRGAMIHIAGVVDVVTASENVHWRSTSSSYSRVHASEVDAGGTSKVARTMKG